MGRLVRLLALISLGLMGCSNRPDATRQTGATPFVFQALNLRQQDARGRLLWRVNSPEARYDLGRRIAQSRQLTGEIFANGTPLYRLQAQHGTVIGDGEVLQLEGGVTVQRLGGDPVTIRAERMRWYPRQQRLELDRQAQANTPHLRLVARRATLWFDRDRLELRGNPELQQGNLKLRVQQLVWSPGRGVLSAPGPASASSPGAPGTAARTLQAAGISGNTQTRSLVLDAPVTLHAPDQRAWLKAQTSHVDLLSNIIRSDLPFQGEIAQLRIRGKAFALNLNNQTATILGRCHLQQPDASLDAQQCRWNWRTQSVLATGGVAVQRLGNQQRTHATTLAGKLGPQGELRFSSEGSRVRSSFRLPKRSPSKGSPAPAIRL
jgi:LPS export ABC transporter protein LptC